MGCSNPLICIDLAAVIHVGTNTAPGKKLAMQARASFQYVRIRFASLDNGRSGNSQISFPILSAPDQEKSVSHQTASLRNGRLLQPCKTAGAEPITIVILETVQPFEKPQNPVIPDVFQTTASILLLLFSIPLSLLERVSLNDK